MSAVSDADRPHDPIINVLLATFAGLGLPRTLNLHVPASEPLSTLYARIHDRLPRSLDRLVLTTVSNKQILSNDETSVASLLDSPNDRLLSLRICGRLCGGKGGFGSQLRAAGGRMSSRKKRDRQENVNGSNRNLDGRRLRTIDEAKRLAEYLAVKPEMEQREREERKKRWEAVVNAAERREEDVRSGRIGANQGRLDADYVESKASAEEKTREAVIKAMMDNRAHLPRTGSESSKDGSGESTDERDESSVSYESDASNLSKPETAVNLFGWDEGSGDSESEQGDESVDRQNPEVDINLRTPPHIGKGKCKAQ